jgi:ribulose-bisphosphate carboxylase large chain
MLASFLTLTIGNNQGMGDVDYAKMHDFWIPPDFLRLFDGPATDISDLWRVLGRPVTEGGFIVGTIIKPKLGLRPQPFARAAYDFWLGGDFIKNDEPQGNQVFARLKETTRAVADAMRRAQDETGQAKLFSANITADDFREMIARGEYILETFAENADHVAFLVDGYVAGPAAVTTARRCFPLQYLHYHRAGHGAVTSPQSQRGYTAFVLAKMARLQGASGIHVGTMSYGKMEGERGDTDIAHMIERDSADGPFFHQEWLGMRPTTPIISGGMNALRLPGFFGNLGHSNLILTAGGGSYGHLDGPAAGAISLRQAEHCWRCGADPLEFAREHREFARAFESFPGDADRLFPGWRNSLDAAA